MNSKTKNFIHSVEELVWKHDIDYMDAIILYCKNNSIEPESVATIVKNNDYLKSKMQIEAENLNLLPRTNRLPV